MPPTVKRVLVGSLRWPAGGSLGRGVDENTALILAPTPALVLVLVLALVLALAVAVAVALALAVDA